MSDGRSRISRRASNHARRLAREYGPWTSEEQADRAAAVADFRALAEMVRETMGSDPKSTPRQLARLRGKADHELGVLLAMTNGRRKPQDLAAQMAALHEARRG